MKNFKKNAAAVAEHNSNPNVTYKQGTNDASGLSEKEKDKRRGFKHDDKSVKGDSSFKNKVKGSPPAAVSYVK